MAYMRVSSLFVLTLLQLCRAEISDSLPESWYSANVINDGFQPKPISEIFSTESPFSSTNPIVVLPKESSSVPDEILLLSTLPPPRKISTTSSSTVDFTKTSVIPHSTLRPSTFETIAPSNLQTIPPSTLQTIPPSSLQTVPPSTFQSTLSTFQSTPSTLPDFTPTETPQQPPIITQFITEQTQPPVQPLFPIQPYLNQATFVQPLPQSQQQLQPLSQTSASRSAQTQSQQIRLELVPQNQVQVQNSEQITSTLQQQPLTSTAGPLSNYFLIYQQAPQSIQGFPGSTGTSQEMSQFTTATQGPTTRAPSTVIIQPAPTVSPPSPRTAPPTSTTLAPSTVRVTTPTTRITSNCRNFTNPPSTLSPLSPISGLMPLRIRVIAPSGSITNVNFKSAAVKTTTTRRPTTTRSRKTSKPKRNTFERCIDGCKGRREPICAAPLASSFLDVDALKGFPSICHMACHNSYRKDAYEKLVDGRCGRLRTRIKTFDSNTKLKRDELNKAQYFIDNSGTKTIVEVSGLP